MAKYKIKVIAVLLKNGKTASHGDLVEETQLNQPADKLVKGGYIEKPTKEELEDWKKANEPDEKSEALAKAEAEQEKAAKEACEKAKADKEAVAEEEAKKAAEAIPVKSAKEEQK